MKVCTMCGETLVKSLFRKKQGKCIQCQDRYQKDYAIANKERRIEYCKAYYEKNKERISKKNKEYYLKNRERMLAVNRQWRKEHPDKMREYLAAYSENNPEKIREYKRNYQNKYEKRNINKKLSNRVSHQIYLSLKGNKAGKHWEDLVGYSLDDLKCHLERKFKDGMTWENYGEWHIDHIIPVSAFNFSSFVDIDFKKCWSIKNLQPLWRLDNLSKGGKLRNPFQPSLQIVDYAKKLKATIEP